MTTIYDIAKAAGVTATTVSNVLAGKGSVSAATRARVLRYIQELKYQPNLVARSLIKGRTGVIGFAVRSLDNPFYAELAAVVENLAYQVGLRVFMTTFSLGEQTGTQLLKDLTARRVDGLLVAPGCPSPQLIHSIVEQHIPVVYCLWEEELPEQTLAVTFDFAQAGRLAAEHLLQLGHRRIGIITDMTPAGENTHFQRIREFQAALAEQGIVSDPQLLQAGNSSFESGKQAFQRLWVLETPPTAIFATNDLMAIGVMSAAWEAGLHIPADLSVVGLDNILQARYVTPPLTTIMIDKAALMSQAIDVLLKEIEGQHTPAIPIIPASLVVRNSTGPPRTKM